MIDYDDSSLLTMFETLIGAGWAGRSAAPSNSWTVSWEGEMQLHPEINWDDPTYKWVANVKKP
jgi:hypothetical protein